MEKVGFLPWARLLWTKSNKHTASVFHIFPEEQCVLCNILNPNSFEEVNTRSYWKSFY
jgi:hypothetical protein